MSNGVRHTFLQKILILLWMAIAMEGAPYAYITDTCNAKVNVIDTATNSVIAPPISVGNSPFGAVVSPSGTRVYIANALDNTVSVIDPTKINTAFDPVIATIAVGPEPYSVAVNPAGNLLYVGNNGFGSNNTISVVDTSSNTVVGTIFVQNGPAGMAFNPTGSRLYVLNNPASTLSVIDTGAGVVVATIPLNNARCASEVVVNADGTRVYVGSCDGELVNVIDTSTNTVIATIPVPGRPSGLSLTPDGTRLYVAIAFGANKMSVIDTMTNSVVTNISMPSDVSSVAIKSDGTRAYVTSGQGAVYVVDVATNTIVATVSVPCAYSFGPNFIAPPPTPETLPSVPVWIGLKNSDDQGTQFDLRAEISRNGTLLSSGESRCVTDVTRNAASAKQVIIQVNNSLATFSSGDSLALKILARIGTNPDNSKCAGPGGSHSSAAGLRLYYDSSDRPSGMNAAIGTSPLNDYFLHSSGTNFFLNALMPITTTAKSKDSTSLNFAQGNLWKEIGTWSMTIP